MCSVPGLWKSQICLEFNVNNFNDNLTKGWDDSACKSLKSTGNESSDKWGSSLKLSNKAAMSRKWGTAKLLVVLWFRMRGLWRLVCSPFSTIDPFWSCPCAIVERNWKINAPLNWYKSRIGFVFNNMCHHISGAKNQAGAANLHNPQQLFVSPIPKPSISQTFTLR